MQKIISRLFGSTILEKFIANNQHDFFIKSKTYIAWYFTFVAIISILYLIFAEPKIILYIVYSLIGLLFILLHIFVVKNFNMAFDNPISISQIKLNQSIKSNNFFVFLSKIFFLQMRIFLLSTWLLGNLLIQGKSNSRFSDVFTNLMPENSFTTLINGFVNWVVFVSLLVGFGIYKYYLKSSNLRLAKCLLPNANNQPRIFFYNILLGIESYIRVISFVTLLTVLSVAIFDIVADKFKLFSFLKYPMITSFAIMIVFSCSKKNLEKSIDFLCKKRSMDFINIFMILFLVISVTVFIVNQVLLNQIEFLKIIPENLITTSSVGNMFFKNTIINQDRIKILFVALNIMLTFGAATDLFLEKINGIKIWLVYFASLVFPVVYSVLFYKFNFSSILNNLLTTDLANVLILFSMITIFKMNYKNIYHSFCFFGLKNNVSKEMPQSTKIGFSIVIKRTIIMYFLYLSSYYVFAWILTEHAMVLGILFLLPVIAMLLIKILWRIPIAIDF